LFYNQIIQLLFNFPLDLKTDQGTMFWSGSKKSPIPIKFDITDKTHTDFVISSSILHAHNFNISPPTSYDYKSSIQNIHVPEFKAKSGIKISTTKEEEDKMNEELGGNQGDEFKELIDKIPEIKDLVLVPIEFEKDDNTNYHIQFITACSNLRARNYKIPEADQHKTKGIAGKIIPAMITTTALITGLVGLEIYKVIQGKKQIGGL